MTFNFVYAIRLLSLAVFLLNVVHAKDLEISVAELESLADANHKGPIIDLLKAFDTEYHQGALNLSVYPFKRSMQNVLTGVADAHYPLLENPLIPQEALPFYYSTKAVGSIAFALYTNVNNIISKETLTKAQFVLTDRVLRQLNFVGKSKLGVLLNQKFPTWSLFKKAIKNLLSTDVYQRHISEISRLSFPYKIETDSAHTEFFAFPTSPIASAKQGLRRLGLSRADVYIFAVAATDPVIVANKYAFIHREFYREFEIKFVLAKNEQGIEIDKILSHILAQALDKQSTNKLLKLSIPQPAFKDWQPSKMPW